MLVLIDTKADKANCGVCGALVFRKGEDAFAASQRHINEGCKK